MTEEKLHIEYSSINVWTLAYLINLAVLFIIGIIFITFVPNSFSYKNTGCILLGTLFIINVAVTIFLPRYKYNFWSYNLDRETLTLEFGVLLRKKVIIPINRIQYIDSSQGPILRMFSLIDLTIITAGGTFTIPCLSLPVAETLTKEIAHIVRKDI